MPEPKKKKKGKKGLIPLPLDPETDVGTVDRQENPRTPR